MSSNSKSARDHVGVQLQLSDLNFCNRTPVIGYPRDFLVNYARFNSFLSNLFYAFAQKKFLEDIFNSEICNRYD